MADYPTTAYNPSSKSAGQTIQASFFNDPEAEIRAIELALLTNGLAHDLKFVDATHDIGNSGAFRPRDLFLSRNATIGGTLAVTGNATLSGTLGVTGVATFSASPVISANSANLSFSGTGTKQISTASGTALQLSPGGTAAMIVGTALRFPNVIATTGSAANAFIDSTDQNLILRSTSTLAAKNWRPLTLAEAQRALALQPIAFTSRLPADDPQRLFYGFGAEPTSAVDGAFGAADRANYDVRAIVAALTRIVQDHERRLEAA